MRRPESLARFFTAPTLAALLTGMLWTAAGCGKPAAWGEENSLILIAADSLWQHVEDTTYAELERRIFTTREEKRFVVTQVDPASPDIEEFRFFKRVLVFGTPEDPTLRQVAEAAGVAGSLRVPSVFEARDVWARDQVVVGAVLDPARPLESWRSQLPAVFALVDANFRATVRNKMFVTGPDTALARRLAERFGFTIVVPVVYDDVTRGLGGGDSLVILRNDNPDPSQLIRSVLVAWREPPLDSLTAEAAYTWRAAIDSVQYNVPQRIDTTHATTRRFEVDGHPALEVTGVWQDEGGAVPAGGPFIVWLVQCPGRTFFLDAWLYAPNEPKYEYVLQLREILNSFGCTGARETARMEDSAEGSRHAVEDGRARDAG